MKLWTQTTAAGLVALAATQAATAQEAQCFQNGHYLVIAQERSESVGTDFIIRPPARGKIKCEFVPAQGDLLLDDRDEALWYAGLAGHYLALTRSTGPDGDVVIYDIATQTVVVDVPADDDLAVDEDGIIYWERVAQGTAENCPEFAEYDANGLGAVIAEERVFEVSSGAITASGDNRCSATQ